MKTALLIVDVQNDYFPGGKFPLVNPEGALKNIQTVLAGFREGGRPVIHVRHINPNPQAAFFAVGTPGAEIKSELSPAPGETVVVKQAPSSFLNTDLKNILAQLDIGHLVVCGMMTHMCIDTTVRAAMDQGLKVTLIEDACATCDLTFEGQTFPAATVHKVFMAALNGRFAQVTKTKDFSLE